jgi:Metallo-peptidase family M12B Reprolysin-like
MIALHNNATIDHSEYDLSVLTAVSRPGVRGGCAWYVVCLEGNTDHKASGMVTSDSGGTGSTSGVLAHEVGHMLGARHTFTGQDGSCTVGEFFAGNSESGYEPGSGTTRMSYNRNCDSDNVDISADPPSDQYFHSRSFDEIVENVFNGDGADCGSLIDTGNLPPQVDAGPDYAIRA